MGSRANFNPSWRRTRSARCRTARTVATPGRRRHQTPGQPSVSNVRRPSPGNDGLPRRQSYAAVGDGFDSLDVDRPLRESKGTVSQTKGWLP
jgi:hypothetical protein